MSVEIKILAKEGCKSMTIDLWPELPLSEWQDTLFYILNLGDQKNVTYLQI